MRSRYKTQGGTEALFDEAESKFSGNAANANIWIIWNFNKFACTKQPLYLTILYGTYTSGGMATFSAEF